jgi:tRNA pseudouridine38-40 synthase
VLQDALASLTEGPVRLRGAGRTDAGVHALGQVVSLEDAAGLDADVVMRAMPALLDTDVAVTDVQEGPADFDARFSAQWRSYVYLLWCAEAPNPLYDRYSVWIRDAVDHVALSEAMRSIVGAHDFSSFGRVREDQSPIRRVIEATAVADGPLVRIRVTGESFLHQMVRSLVGAALEVGTGRKPVSWMRDVLAAKDRAAAARVAPAKGLTLTDVGYKDADWPRRQPTAWPWSDRILPQKERCA